MTSQKEERMQKTNWDMAFANLIIGLVLGILFSTMTAEDPFEMSFRIFVIWMGVLTFYLINKGDRR